MNMTVVQVNALHEILTDLRDEDADKLLSYAAFLNHVRQAEDEADAAAYTERKGEPSYSLEEVKRSLGIEQ
jgi:hypothetical protein